MRSIGIILNDIIQIFVLALFARLILDYARMFAPQWRPKGIMLALSEFVYSVTDPAIRFVRRFVPPLRLGPVSIDLSFIVVFFAAQLIGRALLAL